MKKILSTSLASLGLISISASLMAHDGDGHTHPPKGKGVTEVARTGNGAFTYETVPGFGKLPENKNLGPTHGGVVVDAQGLIYTSTDNAMSICVFKPDGTFVKAMAPECQGIHGMNIVTEGDKQFIYAAQLKPSKETKKPRAVKLDLDGNIVLQIPNKNTGEIPGGLRGLTSIATAPDGSIFVSMGYGSNLVHKFDQTGKRLMTFGGRGGAMDKFNTPHGLAIDTRFGAPRLLVCDRAKNRLVHFDLNGKWIGEHAKNLRRPCAVSILGDHCAVAELQARVTIVDKNGTPVSFVGDNPNRKQWAGFGVKPADQKPGIFTAPHGLSFDKDGNLYVQDWNATGRISKLKLIK
ncbi:MAG: 6-bladed beta-propeller [Akkermansiaceae bacterium]